jgi:hypothetical protein
VSGPAAAKYTPVAAATASAAAGAPLQLKLRSVLKKNAAPPAGASYLVVVLTSRTDPTMRYGFAVQLRSVTAAPAKPKVNRKH